MTGLARGGDGVQPSRAPQDAVLDQVWQAHRALTTAAHRWRREEADLLEARAQAIENALASSVTMTEVAEVLEVPVGRVQRFRRYKVRPGGSR